MHLFIHWSRQYIEAIGCLIPLPIDIELSNEIISNTLNLVYHFKNLLDDRGSVPL